MRKVDTKLYSLNKYAKTLILYEVATVASVLHHFVVFSRGSLLATKFTNEAILCFRLDLDAAKSRLRKARSVDTQQAVSYFIFRQLDNFHNSF